MIYVNNLMLFVDFQHFNEIITELLSEYKY